MINVTIVEFAQIAGYGTKGAIPDTQKRPQYIERLAYFSSNFFFLILIDLSELFN